MLYFLENSTNLNDVGAYFQVKSMSDGYDYNASNSIFAVDRLSNDEIPVFEPDLNSFVLKPKAKLTDVISTGYASDKGFLLNDKVKLLLQRFTIDKGIYYPATVIYKKQNLFYSFLYIASYLIEKEIITFSKSSFFEKKISEILKKMSFDSFDGMLTYGKKKNPVHVIEHEYLFLKKEVLEIDMFRIGYVDIKIIISERLKGEFEAQKITGVKFTKVENIFIE